jgi:hypothetical protein
MYIDSFNVLIEDVGTLNVATGISVDVVSKTPLYWCQSLFGPCNMVKLKRIGIPHVLEQPAKRTMHENVPLKIDDGSLKLYDIISTE